MGRIEMSSNQPLLADPGSLRILMVSARYFPFMGGIESHIHEVGRRMVARGHQVCVLTADPTGKLPASETIEGMNVVRVPAWLPYTDYCLAPRLGTSIKAGAWDVVHVQGYHTFSAPFAMMASLLRKLPFVLTFHSGGHSSRMRNRIRSLQYAMLRPLVRRATRLIAVSRFEAEFFSEKMRIESGLFSVVPNGASLPKPDATSSGATTRDRANGPLIVSLGRLERYKGHHRVIEAFASLRQHVPDAKLRVLGEGPCKNELLAQVDRLGLRECVQIGAIPAKERHIMANLLASTNLVVLFSEYEAHPVAVMEALSLRVPVLTSDTSGFRELAEQGLVTAISIDSSADQLAQAIAERLQAPPRAIEVVLPDWDDCTDRLLAVYRSAIREIPGVQHRSDASLSPAGNVVE